MEWVGFKDKNAEEGTLRVLIDAIDDDGRKAVLEVVSETAQEELRSLAMARSLEGRHGSWVAPTLTRRSRLAGSGLLYYPFPGQVVDHPSVLAGSLEHIVGSARDLRCLMGCMG